MTELEGQQVKNIKCLRKLLDTENCKVYPAFLNGTASAPSEKHPTMRFGVAVTKDALDGNLSELGRWAMAIIFYRPKTKKQKRGGKE